VGADGEEGEEEDDGVVGRPLGVGRVVEQSCWGRMKSRSGLDPQWKRRIDWDWAPSRAIGDSGEVAVYWKGRRSKMRR